ncbi:MAG TPA: peptidylprolyl isomerase [Sphingomicrobium sp.]|nr:peptidylprolyl isomerase [Sphingomicrobium sp.]
MSRDGEPQSPGQTNVRGTFRQLLRTVFKEPLLHFLLIGLLLFLLYALLGGSGSDRSIRIDDKVVAGLITRFEATWQRPPTADELTRLVESHIRDEIFYREGLALGLDRDDPAIRRLVRQKFEVLAEESGAASSPTEAELDSWLQTHADRYAEPTLVSFEQVLIDPSLEGAEAEAALRGTRGALLAGADPAGIGASRMLPARFDLFPLDLVERDFGDGFAKAMATIRPGQWEGPIRSGYGAHLVKIEKRMPGRLPPLDKVRKAVARDFEADRRARAADATLRRLRDDYRIELTAALPATKFP